MIYTKLNNTLLRFICNNEDSVMLANITLDFVNCMLLFILLPCSSWKHGAVKR